MARREKGSGSVRELSPGRYQLRVYAGPDPVTGRPRSATKVVRAKNITEARTLLSRFVAERLDVKPSSTAPVSVILAEYVQALETRRKAPRTIAEARRIADRVLTPAIGDVPVGELTGLQIDELVRRHDGLAPSSVRRYVAVLSAALTLAVENGWVATSPLRRKNLPAVEKSPVGVPSLDEVRVLIGALEGEVWKMAVRLASVTGLRRGELCGLRWSDIDWKGGRIHVRRSIYRLRGESVPKSTKSGRERVVVLAEPVRELLKAWAEVVRSEAGKVDLEPRPDGYVLSKWPDGSRPLNPDTLSTNVHKAAVKAGIPHVHFHSLRHLAATTMIAAGVDVRQAADTLGHGDGGKLLLETYTHPTTDRQRAAATAMAGALIPGE